MSRLGVAEDIAELAIGHVRADLIARYNKDQAWEGRCDAFARVSTHVESLIGARDRSTKVITYVTSEKASARPFVRRARGCPGRSPAREAGAHLPRRAGNALQRLVESKVMP